MISLTTKAFLHKYHEMNFKLPENINLNTGEYEIVIVINTIPLQDSTKKTLTFSDHNYMLENEGITFSREDIYGDFGR